MSNHQIIKVRQNEAAIVFRDDGKVEIANPKEALNKNCAPAFAVCCAAATHKFLYKRFRAIIIEELTKRKSVFVNEYEAKQFEAFINLLSED